MKKQKIAFYVLIFFCIFALIFCLYFNNLKTTKYFIKKIIIKVKMEKITDNFYIGKVYYLKEKITFYFLAIKNKKAQIITFSGYNKDNLPNEIYYLLFNNRFIDIDDKYFEDYKIFIFNEKEYKQFKTFINETEKIITIINYNEENNTEIINLTEKQIKKIKEW